MILSMIDLVAFDFDRRLEIGTSQTQNSLYNYIVELRNDHFQILGFPKIRQVK